MGFLPSSATSAIDAYIQNKLTLELSARLKDQTSIVRELADKAEDTVWSRLKRYTVILDIGAAILAYFGLKPLYDIYHQIEPMVNAADQRIQTVTQTIGRISSEITPLRTAVDRLSSDVDGQTKRVTEKGNEISRKLDSLEVAANEAEKRGEAYQIRSAELSDRLEAIAKGLEKRVEQISQQVANVSIRQAYPTIGKERFVTYQGARWERKKEKHPDDKWVAITIDPMAYGDVTEAELQTLMEELNKSRYTLFLGAFGIGGPIITGYGPFGTSAQSAVFYFQAEGKAMAEEVASIVSKVLSLKSVQTQLVDPSTMDYDDYRKFTIENSGLDLQILLRSLHG
jgi:hypothetical protein